MDNFSTSVGSLCDTLPYTRENPVHKTINFHAKQQILQLPFYFLPLLTNLRDNSHFLTLYMLVDSIRLQPCHAGLGSIPSLSSEFLTSLCVKLNTVQRNSMTLKWHFKIFFKLCYNMCASLLITKSSTGSNNYHNFKVVMSIKNILKDIHPVDVYENICDFYWWQSHRYC